MLSSCLVFGPSKNQFTPKLICVQLKFVWSGKFCAKNLDPLEHHRKHRASPRIAPPLPVHAISGNGSGWTAHHSSRKWAIHRYLRGGQRGWTGSQFPFFAWCSQGKHLKTSLRLEITIKWFLVFWRKNITGFQLVQVCWEKYGLSNESKGQSALKDQANISSNCRRTASPVVWVFRTESLSWPTIFSSF